MGPQLSADDRRLHPLIREYEQVFGPGPLPEAIQVAFTPSRRHTPREAAAIRWLVDRLGLGLLKHCLAGAEGDDALSPGDVTLLHWLQTDSTPRHRTEGDDDGDGHWWKGIQSGDPNHHTYVIPTGTRLFHVTHGGVEAEDILQRGNYFGDERMVFENFLFDYVERHPLGGRLFEYELRHPVNLLAMDNEATIRLLRQHVDPGETLQRLSWAYPCSTAERCMARHYGGHNDRPLMRDLCDLLSSAEQAAGLLPPLHGVASLFMPGGQRGPIPASRADMVPPELFLCVPQQHLRIVTGTWLKKDLTRFRYVDGTWEPSRPMRKPGSSADDR